MTPQRHNFETKRASLVAALSKAETVTEIQHIAGELIFLAVRLTQAQGGCVCGSVAEGDR